MNVFGYLAFAGYAFWATTNGPIWLSNLTVIASLILLLWLLRRKKS